MPTVSRLDNIRPQFFDSNGNPLVGGKLFFYDAGTTSKRATYNSSAGTVANTNPIVLNSRGEPGVEIWLDTAYLYKVVLAPATDTDPPTSPIWTEDNIDPINRVSTDTQGTNLVWGPTVTIPATGTYFEVTSGSGTATSLSSSSPNGRVITIRFNVGGIAIAYDGSALILQGDANRSLEVNDVLTFRKITGGWIEQSSKELPPRVRVAAVLALSQLAR